MKILSCKTQYGHVSIFEETSVWTIKNVGQFATTWETTKSYDDAMFLFAQSVSVDELLAA